MKKIYCLLLVILCVILVTIPAAAENKMMLSAGLRHNSIEHRKLDDSDNQWGIIVRAEFKPASDLLVLVSQSFTAERSSLSDIRFHVQASLMYEFITDPNLTIYGGLGYQFAKTKFLKPSDDPEVVSGEAMPVSGGGIIAATQANFGIAENLKIKVNICGSPWYSWTYESNSKSYKGVNYSYQLSAEYDFNPQWGMYMGYAGGSASIQIQETEKHSYTNGGFTAGISRKF